MERISCYDCALKLENKVEKKDNNYKVYQNQQRPNVYSVFSSQDTMAIAYQLQGTSFYILHNCIVKVFSIVRTAGSMEDSLGTSSSDSTY